MTPFLSRCLTYDDVQILPRYSEILSRSLCNTKSKLSRNITLDIPIVAAPMDTVCEANMAIALAKLGGIGFVHRFMSLDDQYQQVFVAKRMGGLVGAAVGSTDNFIERARICVEGGADVILVDVAHGDHILVKNAITALKSLKVDIIAGNVATFGGAKNLVDWGADGVRVGIGNGSLCETRIRTGVGVPQISAIMSCKYNNVPIIADGGIRNPGDVAKALGAGASTVMLGSLLAGTDESPGEPSKVGMFPNFKQFKKYQGSASLDSKAKRNEEGKYIEGNSTLIPYKGSVANIVNEIMDGVRSSMSYVNALNMDQFHENAEFVEVTHAGMIEAHPHLMLKEE
jgi:IMP dehydrogenase